MKKFISEKGLVLPLDRANVDTDYIIPKQFLKSIKRTGFGKTCSTRHVTSTRVCPTRNAPAVRSIKISSPTSRATRAHQFCWPAKTSVVGRAANMRRGHWMTTAFAALSRPAMRISSLTTV